MGSSVLFQKCCSKGVKNLFIWQMTPHISLLEEGLPLYFGKNYTTVTIYKTVWYCCSLSMMTSSNGNIFRVTGPLCGEFTGPGEFPTQRPVTRSFDVFFDLRLNKRLSKQPWSWWLQTPSWSLWRHCNGSWWQHDMEMLSAWLALCEGIHWSPVDSPHKVISNAELRCCLSCYPRQAVEQTIELSVI